MTKEKRERVPLNALVVMLPQLVDAQSHPRTAFRCYSLPVRYLRETVWNGIAFAVNERRLLYAPDVGRS